MIIVQLSGGMGNQMFQYAFGKQLALKHQTILKLDLEFFKTYEWHEYSLGPFNIIENIATQKEVKKSKGIPSSTFERLLFKFNLIKKGVHIRERNLDYQPEMLNLPNKSYIEGYWQSESYFSEIATILKKEFSVREPASFDNQQMLDLINNHHSVALHIRRGNYANIEAVNNVHGLTPLSYYYTAIEYLKNRHPDVCFFIFSDDIQWAKANLQIKEKHYFVDQNSDSTDYEDMRMMYSCKHNIIANSTFSWWAAWLNNNPNKIVIAPQKWFNNEMRKTVDIIPNSWLII